MMPDQDCRERPARMPLAIRPTPKAGRGAGGRGTRQHGSRRGGCRLRPNGLRGSRKRRDRVFRESVLGDLVRKHHPGGQAIIASPSHSLPMSVTDHFVSRYMHREFHGESLSRERFRAWFPWHRPCRRKARKRLAGCGNTISLGPARLRYPPIRSGRRRPRALKRLSTHRIPKPAGPARTR